MKDYYIRRKQILYNNEILDNNNASLGSVLFEQLKKEMLLWFISSSKNSEERLCDMKVTVPVAMFIEVVAIKKR